jgi:hypothetical protein
MKGQTIQDPQAYEPTWIIFRDKEGEKPEIMTRRKLTERIEEARLLRERELC